MKNLDFHQQNSLGIIPPYLILTSWSAELPGILWGLLCMFQISSPLVRSVLMCVAIC